MRWDQDASGTITEDERVYARGEYREGELGADYHIRIAKWARKDVFGASLQLGGGYYNRSHSIAGISDIGTFTMSGADNPARPDQRIRLWRYNQVSIAGGLAGSQLRLSIRNTVEPVVVQ